VLVVSRRRRGGSAVASALAALAAVLAGCALLAGCGGSGAARADGAGTSHQASPAYTEFDTETSHQEQVYGNGGAHDPRQFPVQVTVPGSVVAVWIPAQLLLVATNATPTTGGAYVTVAVKGRAAPARIALRIAEAAARATFAAHPNGPS
jgi:hypothetical protein